ncbi:MAG: hypothetical protein J6X69_06925 [Bacteroidales bacterium]|nr:hypothetical protein [Bacteroidales bacterium]
MEAKTKEYIAQMRAFLRDAENYEPSEFQSIVRGLSESFGRYEERLTANTQEFDIEGGPIFWGLVEKATLLFNLCDDQYVRSEETKLSEQFDVWGNGFRELACEYEAKNFQKIQRIIIDSVKNRARSNPDGLGMLIQGNETRQISKENMTHIAENLMYMAKDITAYVQKYKTNGWAWRIDTRIVAQYIFEKTIELCYKLEVNNDHPSWKYDILDAFSYYEFNTPQQLQDSINAVVLKLGNVVDDAINVIGKEKYNTCPLDVWFYPLLYSVGLEGMEFFKRTA